MSRMSTTFSNKGSLTMTFRCSAGVFSLSPMLWISFISPVSLSIRKRPSSSPNMNTSTLTNVRMWAQWHFKHYPSSAGIKHLRGWRSWLRNWVLCLHPLHEWDPGKSPTWCPVTHKYVALQIKSGSCGWTLWSGIFIGDVIEKRWCLNHIQKQI